MMRPPERVEVPEEGELRHERIARVLAVFIVVATLGVATVEYLHSIAEKNADAAGVNAQLLSVERQGELVRADDAARTNIDINGYAQQQLTQQANAFQEYLAPGVTEGSAQANVLQLEENRWSQLAALTGDLTSVKATGPTSPQGDLRFPNVLFSQAERASDRLFALEDASNQLRDDWLGRAGLLSVILTLFAVAIYLFGLSLTLQAGIRRLLAGLGVVLVLVGTVATVALQFSTPSASPDAAAADYAGGVYALHTFYTQPGDQGLKQADAAFTKAINERPNFAQAYLQRSEVRFLLGSPERDQNAGGVTSAAALQSQGADLVQAYALGLRDKQLLNNLAANRLLLAIANNRSDYYTAALGYLNAALALDPNDPLLYYNKALAQLGQGSAGDATQTYQAAVEHTLYTDAGRRVARNDPVTEQSYVGAALTPLDLLAGHRTDLASQVQSMKTLIVNGVGRHQAGPGGTSTVKNAVLDVFPGELQWTADIDNFDPSKDAVSTQWYFQDSQKLGWTVISSISGVNAPTFDNGTGRSNSYYLIVRFLQASGQCLQPGHYKVEIYINGRLSGTASSDGTQPSLQADPMPDIALSFCHPADWVQDQSNVSRGFSNGFTSKGGTTGAYFVRFQNPQLPSGTDPATEALDFRTQILTLFKAVLPSDAGTPSIDCGSNSSGTNTLAWGPTLDANCNRTTAFFLGLTGANEAWYDYNGGILHIGTGVTSDGAVVGAITFGPEASWQVSTEPAPDIVFDAIISTQ